MKTFTAGFFVVVSILVGVISFTGCFSPPAPPIQFHLPTGYVGVFVLELDSVNGVSVSLTNGKYTYFIPTNGLLRVKTFDPFNRSHTEVAVFADGRQIPMYLDSNLPTNAVACREAGEHKDYGPNGAVRHCLAFVIGTEAQKWEADEKRQWLQLMP